MLRKNNDATYAHCLGVSLYAALMAKQVGWTSASTIFKISMAGLLHDIGKKEIPARVLMKTRIEMTPEEVQLYETHPTRGRDLLSQVSCVPEEVIVAAAQHHENMSGLGFPYRIPRVKIHPFAKIILVADEFCHLALHGPTGQGLHPHEALKKIFETRSQDFDPIFVRALMEIFKYPVPENLKRLRMVGDTRAS
jgi:putative nucleotidyltransferase with HDIG domain